MARTIHVAHSPDSDDAFMFYALAADKLDTGDLRYVHELSDIESLNQRALRGELEVTAVSIHAYAYLWRQYALLGSGSSMGDGYGPRLVSTRARPADPRAALRGLRRHMPDGKARSAAREPSVCDERACLSEPFGFEIAGRIEHLLHSRSPAGALITDDDHVARLDSPTEDALNGRILALEHPSRATEHEDAFVDACRLHDAAVLRKVALQHRKTAIL